MFRIYKYRLPFKEISTVNLPVGSKIVRVGGDDGAIYIWAIVDINADIETRTFHLFKTGSDMPEDISDYLYHGCGAIFVQMELMMYVFEKIDSQVPYVNRSSLIDIKDQFES